MRRRGRAPSPPPRRRVRKQMASGRKAMLSEMIETSLQLVVLTRSALANTTSSSGRIENEVMADVGRRSSSARRPMWRRAAAKATVMMATWFAPLSPQAGTSRNARQYARVPVPRHTIWDDHRKHRAGFIFSCVSITCIKLQGSILSPLFSPAAERKRGSTPKMRNYTV